MDNYRVDPRIVMIFNRVHSHYREVAKELYAWSVAFLEAGIPSRVVIPISGTSRHCGLVDFATA
jgi:hypothetical protein